MAADFQPVPSLTDVVKSPAMAKALSPMLALAFWVQLASKKPVAGPDEKVRPLTRKPRSTCHTSATVQSPVIVLRSSTIPPLIVEAGSILQLWKLTENRSPVDTTPTGAASTSNPAVIEPP